MQRFIVRGWFPGFMARQRIIKFFVGSAHLRPESTDFRSINVWKPIYHWKQVDPITPWLLSKHALGQGADDRGGAGIGLLGPAGIGAKQDRRIMAASGRDDVDWNAGIKEQGF